MLAFEKQCQTVDEADVPREVLRSLGPRALNCEAIRGGPQDRSRGCRYALNYAILLQGVGDTEGCEALREVLRINPEHAVTHGNYALLLQSMGDTEGAAKTTRRSSGSIQSMPRRTTTTPTCLGTWATLSRELRSTTRRPSGSSRGCRYALQLRQPAEEPGRHSGAAKHYEEALRIDPEDADGTATTPTC